MQTKPSSELIRPTTWTIITPSYAPDLERCKILCRSVDICTPDEIEHILIVDRRDLPAFAELESSRRKILIVEDLLPWWIRPVPMSRRWWLNLRGKPIRSWVLQQTLKIQAAAASNSDAILFLDSDVAFVRPFSPRQMENNGKIALHRVPFSDYKHSLWLRNAANTLCAPAVSQEFNYIGNLVTWRSDVARLLVKRLSDVRKRHWINQFASHWHVSEYMVYGTFVEKVLGLSEAGHFAASLPLIHLSWGHDLVTADGLQSFFDSLTNEQVAIMIHSKNGIDPDKILHHLQPFWDKIPR